MVKVAIYARVSKDEASSDGKLQDPQNQLIPMNKYCEAMGWEVTGIFIDKCSGGSANRPEFQAMLGKVRQKHFDLVLVWALDRFSREGITNTLAYFKQLKDYNTGFVSLQETWLNTKDGISELMLGIISWFAEQEKKRISERTKAALAKKKSEGVKLGRPWHNDIIKGGSNLIGKKAI